MIRANSFDRLSGDAPTYVTLGAFDGIHRGHQHVIGNMVAAARADGVAPAVVSFFPHPVVVLHGKRRGFYIHTPDEKARLIEEMGVEILVIHPFDEAVAHMHAADFLSQMHAALNFSALWAGADFHIGRDREGDLDWLRAQAPVYGFEVHMAEKFCLDGERVSSSSIRAALQAGDVQRVAKLLGRPLRIPGVVVSGMQRGRKIGFPTANLDVWEERAYPGSGVYACRAWLEGEDTPHMAAVNIGVRPTFNGTDHFVSVEAHLLDFNADLYGQTVALDFIARLRPERKFDSIDALTAQITRDVAETRRLLSDPAQVPHAP